VKYSPFVSWHLPLLVIRPKLNRSVDVSCLRSLVASAEEKDNRLPFSRIIDAVTRANIHPQFPKT
jgi:hypothetical protein